MSPAFFHALARSLSFRAKGLTGVTQKALTLVVVSRNKCAAAPARRVVTRKVLPVRCCSGYTSFKQDTSLPGTQEKEDDSTRKSISRHTPRPPQSPHQIDLPSTASPDSFMLPSHYQRHQSDLLEGKIYECESVEDALGVYQRYKEVMEMRHCLSLMRRLSDLIGSSEEDVANLLQNEDFEALSSQVFMQCRRMDVDELIALFKHISRMGLPSDAKLTQAILQMLKNQINDLSLRQLIFLAFLLKKITLTPLSDALLTAIPILISNALASAPLTDLTLSDLSQAFTICCQAKVDGIGTLLQEIYRRGSVRTAPDAMSLVWTLTQMSNPRTLARFLTTDEQLTRDVIMKECLETLAKEIDALSWQQIESTVFKISDSHKKGDRSCYNERFLQALASHTCHSFASFDGASNMLRKMMRMNYLSDELVHYTVKLILSRPENVLEARGSMLPVLSAMAVTSTLSQEDLKGALDVIMTHKTLRLDSEEDNYQKPLLVVAVDLLSVGYFHPQLMDIFTSPDTLSMFMSKYSKEDPNHKRLVLVDQALSVVFQSLNRVPESCLEPGRKLMASHRPTRSNLRAMLLHILRDPSCLVSGVLTEGGIYIDHLLVLDPEGVPIKLRSIDDPLMRNVSIASLNVPAEATKVAILDVGSSMVFRPTNALESQRKLQKTILETEGFKVLPVLQSVIWQHHKKEKLLYLKQELGSGAGVVLS